MGLANKKPKKVKVKGASLMFPFFKFFKEIEMIKMPGTEHNIVFIK